jgi:hypothetical protein
MCCRCNCRKRTANNDCHGGRGEHGADIDVFPSRRRRAFNRIAQIFSQEAEQEVTAVLEAAEAEEEEEDNIDFVGLCEELESLERRVTVQSMHIQQIRLETEGEYQPKEQLEEAGDMPAGELAATKLSKEEAEKQLSDKTAKLNFAAGWQAKTTRDGENHMGDRVDLPIDKEEVQPRRLHKENQPLEQLDKEIEEIRRMMLRSVQEAINKEKLNRGNPSIAAGNMQQQQQSNGADGQLQKRVWDPGGFQQSRGAHEQELMNFSQQWSMMQEHHSNSAMFQLDNTSKHIQ